MNEQIGASTPGDDDAKFDQVPIDFPRPAHAGAVSGAHTKLLMTSYRGRFYSPGCTPPELHARWDASEDLARQFAEKSLESKAGKRSHMSPVDILDQYLSRLIAAGWRSDAEARWVIRRTAALLDWPAPEAAKEPLCNGSDAR